MVYIIGSEDPQSSVVHLDPVGSRTSGLVAPNPLKGVVK
jgi:hypothetical protein